MELRHLRYFMAVADEGSFLRAAEWLHLSQPPLSTQIKDLETELGVRLFDRSPRGAVLTPAGAAFYVEARAVMAGIEHARIAAQRAARGDTGALEIGFVSTVDYSFLPAALKSYRQQFPGVELQLHELTTDAQLRELAAERLDVGIALGPVDEAEIAFTPLLKERLVLAAPAGQPAGSSQTSVTLRALSAEKFVMVPRHLAPGLHDLTIAFCRSVGFRPQITQYAKQMQTVISLVSGGFGFALVPESLQHLQREGVRYVALREDGPQLETGAIYRRRSNNPAIPAFVKAVRDAARAYALTRKPR